MATSALESLAEINGAAPGCIDAQSTYHGTS